MDYHRFNIGRPDIGDMNAWWDENIRRGVITTGFEGVTGDKGEKHLKALAKWDWVLAYVSGKGFVGAGKVKDVSTYHRHETRPDGTLSDHLHERGVVWKFVIRDVRHAIRHDEANLRFPMGTWQRTQPQDRGFAKALIKQLRMAGEDLRPKDVEYWWVLDAVRALGKPSTLDEIESWLDHQHPDGDHSDLIDNACVLTVNDANRRHHDKARKNFRSDAGHPKDVLFREGRRVGVTYSLYDPKIHGVWDIQPGPNGKVAAIKVADALGAAEAALADARTYVYADPLPQFASDHDARTWEMRAVALREGQPEFRSALLQAYGGRCAITGCAIEAILEAAHIRPYREGGSVTSRTDNGLLLRADIHTLLDKGLIWVNSGGLIEISDLLADSEYESLRGRRLRLPEDPAQHPHPSHLAHHRKTTAKQLV